MQDQPTTLADELEDFDRYTEATLGQRLMNFLLDGALSHYGLSQLINYFVGLICGIYIRTSVTIYAMGLEITVPLFSYEIVLISYLLYYSICEKVFKGYTLGKLLSGTRAIRADGGELTFKDAFLRSLSRLVPFEQFSIWSANGLWHDSWTKTRVVKAR
jgi:uncharacterized RDD family membrane protein YckC